MNIKLLHEDAIVPTKATEFAAGFDLYSIEKVMLLPNSTTVVRTGVAVEIPFGCVGMIKARSSLGLKGIHVLAGIIDCDYRGELKVILSIDNESYKIQKTERIAQLLIISLAPIGIHLNVVEELTETERGEKGFGSSNKCPHGIYRNLPNCAICDRAEEQNKLNFAVTHMSVKGITTVCGEDTSKVAYYTSNLNDVTCEKCKRGSKVNYE